jgi:hypothetical protein
MRPAIAALALPALFTWYADPTWPRGMAASDRALAEAAQVRDAVAATGAHAVWADYWDVYRMALLTGESPRWVTLRIIERRPDWVEDARAASPVAYLLRADDAEMRGLLEDAARRGAARIVDTREVGRYRLITTDRTVPDLDLMQAPPTRSWQRLAALAGGGTFLAALAALAWLTSGTRAAPAREDSSATPA